MMPVTRAEIVVRQADSPLARYLLRPGEYFIGRDAACEIQIDAPEISRRHARLTINDTDLVIEDLGSTCGTWCGGEPVTRRLAFTPPKSLRLGSAILEIRFLPEEELAAMTMAPEPQPAVAAQETPPDRKSVV